MVAENDNLSDVKIEDIQLEDAADKSEELVCPFALSLLKEIKEYQNLHGLKHDDYQRYRQYCSRRLHRLYKGLKFLHGGKKFTNKKITPDLFVKDIRYMQIILLQAERAWAYAMDLKQFANTESRKQVHLIAKLKKAVFYAAELASNCVSLKCDTTTQLEAKAYHHYMTGVLLFEQGNWQKSVVSLSAAQKIYNKLADAVEDSELYREKHDEMTPKVQYCLYNIQSMGGENVQGEDGEGLFQELDSIIANKATKSAAAVREIKWEGKGFTISNDDIKIQLVQMEDNIQLAKECSDHDKRLELYEEILSACREISQQIKKGDKTESLELMTDYFTYIRIKNTVDRFLAMAQQVADRLAGVVETRAGSKIARPEDLVRLYDIILQNYADMRDVTSLDKDGDTYQMIDVNTMYYRTKRCFYIAECHLGQSNWLNAIVLYDKCSEHIEQTIQAANALQSSKNQSMIEDLQVLSKQIYSQRCSAHASAFLQTQLVEEEMKEISSDKNKMLADSLEEFKILKNESDLPTIATLPPDFQPIPCKPTFFDISLNHIEFPDLEERVEKESSGILGFTKWIWGK
ncbi:signal recognition particle subunit SRP68-like [Bolinopsis microptera]|uniref:signal recognition particle subunit SRP68-like n=1 Tax=Bolinopsis microptera TaxID=2820187 RepID=UPI00307A4F24